MRQRSQVTPERQPPLQAVENAYVVFPAVEREGFNVPADQMSISAAMAAAERDRQVPQVDVRFAADDDAAP